jgi:hypothetical protein
MNNKENVFGERLRALRRIRNNISQKEFALELGIRSLRFLHMKAER